MNLNYKQTQFELFPGSSKEGQDSQKPKFFFSRITLTLENIIVLTVLIFMGIIVSFSFGVERGKGTVSLLVEDPIVSQEIVLDAEVLEPVEIADQGGRAVLANPISQPFKEIIEKPSILSGLPEDFYTVQVASFKTRKYAEKEAFALKKKGYEIFIVEKGSYLIVCAGKFLKQDEAQGFSYRLKNKYKDCLVRRL